MVPADERPPPADETLTYEDDPTPPRDRQDTDALAPGTQVQRFRILERVGAGGMGVVYAAYDPVLDRKVALKFLLGHTQASKQREDRLLREAQVMAKLRHPNVAAAFDVGTFHGRVFVAMEFVDGQTLRAWLREQRSWPEIRDVFLATGRGLAAAHAAGIVHRDFKPENVLVDTSGVPRVSDFGLARSQTDERDPSDDVPAGPIGLTQTGAVLGTPRYMAPEQQLGLQADARSDQFAFAVALYEAAYQCAPFAGDDSATIADNVVNGRLRAAPTSTRVPVRSRRAIERALSTDAETRFPSINDLLTELEPPRTRLRWALGAAGVLAIGLAALTFAVARTNDRPIANRVTCNGGTGRLAAVWSPDRRAAIERAFAATGDVSASAMSSAFVDRVQAHADDWSAMHRGVCEATHVTGEQSTETLDLRMSCLDRRLQEMDALIQIYSGTLSARQLSRAPAALDKLPQLSACERTEGLRAIAPLPEDPAIHDMVEDVRGVIARARATWVAGDYEAGRDALLSVRDRADATSYAPLRAEFEFELSQHLWVLGESAEARRGFERAAQLAAQGRDGLTEANAWISLMNVVGGLQGQSDEAETYVNVARATLARIDAPPDVEGRFYNNLGVVRHSAGRLREARAAFDRAVKLYRHALGESSPRLALALGNLGGIESVLGDRTSARQHLAESMAIAALTQGHEHLDRAYTLSSLGLISIAEGAYQDALDYADEALRIRHLHVVEPHTEIAYSLGYRSMALAGLGRSDEAVAALERAAEVHDAAESPGHTYKRSLELQLAGALREVERYRDARDAVARATQTYDGDPAPATIATSATLELGLIALAENQLRDARRHCRSAVEQQHQLADDAEPSELAAMLACIAAASPAAEARSTLEPELAELDRKRVSRTELARLDLAHARILAATGDADRARAIAADAVAALANAEGRDVELRSELEAWLAAHR